MFAQALSLPGLSQPGQDPLPGLPACAPAPAPGDATPRNFHPETPPPASQLRLDHTQLTLAPLPIPIQLEMLEPPAPWEADPRPISSPSAPADEQDGRLRPLPGQGTIF